MTNTNHKHPSVCIAARNSGQQGSKARRQVAIECHSTAEDLYTHTGVDIRDLIPPVDEIIEMLKSRAVRKTSVDSKTGKKFVNEFLTLHLDCNVVLLVSTGSGRKINADFSQPYLEWLNRELMSIRPDMLAWHRLDRIFRTSLLGANTLHLCAELGTRIVDGEKGILDGDFGAIMSLLRAKESSDEASRIPVKTRGGQISRTGTDMSTGTVPYAVAQTPPAGMMVVRMKAPNGQLGAGRLCFDTPANYPDSADVAYGLPEVALDGRRVDQVANVRFALSRLGQPGWTIHEVGRALVDRGFSTHRLRMENSVRTAFTHELLNGELHRVLRPIVERLDFYRTGVLPVRFGVAGVKDIEIINCFPPDGRPWASEKDFERIQKYLRTTKGGGPATQGLTGVVVLTEVGPLPLRSAPAERQAGGASYVLRPGEAGQPAALSLPALPHSALAESLVEALAAHADQLLTPLLQQELPEAEPLRRELRLAQERVQGVEEQRQSVIQAMTGRGTDGNPAISGDALAALSEFYNELTEKEFTPAEAEVCRLTAELTRMTERSMQRDPAIRSELLLRMVDSLHDPYDTTYNPHWKGAVRIEKIWREPVRVHDTAGHIIRWEGTIRTAGADQEFGASFDGEYLTGAAGQLPRKVDEALELLLQGIPFEAIKQSNARGVRLALAERLGFDSRYFGLPICPDPRLVRIGAHLAVDPARHSDRVAERLGEPVPLVQAVLSQLTSGRPTWHSVLDEIAATPHSAEGSEEPGTADL